MNKNTILYFDIYMVCYQTGDLRIIQNEKEPRKLLTNKGSNYRESRGVDFEKG